MLYILWSLLNLVAYLGLFYLLFHAVKLLKQRFNVAVAVFFFLGIAALSGRSKPQPKTLSAPNLLAGIPANTPLGNGSATEKTSLGTSSLFILAEYYKQDSVIQPRGLFATVSGFTLGHRWEPSAGTVVQHRNQLQYRLLMHHEWQLLGSTLYTSPSVTLTGMM
ncbi:hypothetical protein [Hymenobacter lucidus]|uniref:DUF481 domain-containing protein n=1 Tax=Hymenobacter lucidus TaxID=2880930 RepID=A0ABS8ALW1_9BACT|nr:hypothetical protein [Hymenobacter lucidus]MCB2407038.1 hypothetical protein [Hymenobacter lucidus]